MTCDNDGYEATYVTEDESAYLCEECALLAEDMGIEVLSLADEEEERLPLAFYAEL